jgi:hypothetical protein
MRFFCGFFLSWPIWCVLCGDVSNFSCVCVGCVVNFRPRVCVCVCESLVGFVNLGLINFGDNWCLLLFWPKVNWGVEF